jgi:uncharacterized protein (TIGR02453 family)
MFTSETLTFLRALKRHNDREWFKARKEQYDAVVKGPSVAFVDRMADALPSFAHNILASPRASLFRVYRDTRFSHDKSPYKTQIGMLFPWRALPRLEGACFYVEVGPDRTLIAGGIYAPQPKQLRAVREHVAAHTKRFRAIVEQRAFKAAFGALQGEQSSRMPMGFPRDHPAGDYLRLKQFICWTEHPPDFAVRPRFFQEVVRRLRQLTPLVCFLNEPLEAKRETSPDRFFLRS